MRTLARALVVVGGLSMTGCQFFFPTPIEGEVDTNKPTQAVRSTGTPYKPGESIKADVFLDGVLAGRGELKVSAPCKVRNQTAVVVTTSGESAGIARLLQKAKSETAGVVDLESSRPIEAHGDATIGEKRAIVDVMFDRASFFFRQVRSEPEKDDKTTLAEIQLPLDETPHDGHSALGYLRNWRPEPGTQAFLWAVYGRYPWRADLVFVGPEVLKTDKGDVKAVRIDGVATKLMGQSLIPSASTPKRPFTMWISDDERRTPLRILLETSVAKVTIELASYSITEPKPAPGTPATATGKAVGNPAAGNPAAIPPCAPLFDEKALRREVKQKKEKQEAEKRERDAARQKAMGDDSALPEKSDDDDKEEKDALERLLKQAN